MPNRSPKHSRTATSAAFFSPKKAAKSAAPGKPCHVRMPSLRHDPVWDAFDSDDELLEPEPEYGDLWGVPDEEAE